MGYNKSINSSISVKSILQSGWSLFRETHEFTDYQNKEVEKAINCYGNKNGCFVYYCLHCEKLVLQSEGCNSRICSCCGKRYTEKFELIKTSLR